jgi:LysM repeat protein
VVQEGHTFWAIAARYEVSLAELFLFNNLTENDSLHPGDELIIRLAEGQAPPPTPTPPASHMVRSGDTVWTIAAWYKVSVADLLWLNGLQEESLLHPGDEIAIRLLEGQTPPPTPTPQIAHIVQSGDTAWSIALRYGLTLDELLAFNGLGPNPMLHPGDALLIRSPTPLPTATSEATATAAPPANDAALRMESSPTATFTPQAPPSSTPAPLSSPTPAPSGGYQGAGQSIFLGTLIAGLGLTALAVAISAVLKRQSL